MKKAICLLLLCACMLCGCSACRNPQAEGEAIAAFCESYEQALALYDIVYGAGLPAADGYAFDPDGATVQYAPVAGSAPYTSLSQMRTQIERLYSEELAKTLCRMAFSDLYMDGTSTPTEGDGEGDDVQPSVTARYREVDGQLQINLAYRPLFTDAAMIPELSAARGKSSTAMRVTLTAPMTSPDGTVHLSAQEFVMAWEGEAWRFDSAPYVSVKAALLAE